MRRTLGVALLLAGCSRGERAAPAQLVASPPADAAVTPAAAVDARKVPAAYAHVIYFVPEPRVKPATAIARCAGAAGRLVLQPLDEPGPADHAVWSHQVLPASEIEVPPAAALAYVGRGIDEQQIAAVQRSAGAVLLTFASPPAHVARTLRDAANAAACVARETKGLIWDDGTRQLFSEAAWRKARVDSFAGDVPLVHEHIIVHSYEDGELMRSVSLGMSKLGLPDLVVNRHARGFRDGTAWLISFAGQTLWERESPGGEALEVDLDVLAPPAAREAATFARAHGGSGKAALRLAVATPEEGDAENRLLEIRFSGAEAHSAVLKELLGAGDQLMMAARDDDELLAASRRARFKLALLRRKFAYGPPPMTRLMVKAPFDTASGGSEYMWIEVLSWRGDVLEGLLMSEPDDVPALKQGARVKVKLASVFDYLHEHDGKEEGNETSHILVRRQEGR